MATAGAPAAKPSKIRIQGNRCIAGTAGCAAAATGRAVPSRSSSGQPYATETPQQLQQLVAPIALYPDSLVASILAASSYPAQITEANDWLASRRNLPPQHLAAEADKQPWDPSVKALLPFPPVLQNMASNLSWTSELGDAYYNQQTEVMDAIQVMRQQAKKAGTLKSNDQIKVTDKDHYISIEARDPQQEVYIPQYDPWQVYGYPIEPWPGWVESPGLWWDGPGLYFGLGFGMGPWWGFGWGWPFWGIDWYGHGIFSTAGLTSRAARHSSIAITTIAATPDLPGPCAPRPRILARIRRAEARLREFAPAHLADTVMAAT